MTAPALAAAAALALATAAPRAEADGSRFALDTFRPVPAGDRFFGVQSADSLGHGAIDAAIVSDLAVAPLSAALVPSTETEVVRVVPYQLFFHLGAAVTLWDVWKASITMPFGPTAMTLDPDHPRADDPIDDRWVAGDLRTALRLRVAGEEGSRLRLALAGALSLPTGDDAAFASDGRVSGGPELVLGGRAGGWTWGATTGAVFRPAARFGGVAIGDELTLGLAAAAPINRVLQLVIEARGAMAVEGDEAPRAATTSVELTVGWRFRLGPIVVAPAPSFGLSRGVGTPLLRTILALSYAPLERTDVSDGGGGSDDGPPPPPPVPDRDGDGVEDARDACADAPGPYRDDPAACGCPDGDGDGTIDAMDACPEEPGPIEGDGGRRGCPPSDRDRDGVLDRDDACPDARGPAGGSPYERGCPRDRDFDGVLDDEDACPDRKGRLALDPARNGCPREGE